MITNPTIAWVILLLALSSFALSPPAVIQENAPKIKIKIKTTAPMIKPIVIIVGK